LKQPLVFDHPTGPIALLCDRILRDGDKIIFEVVEGVWRGSYEPTTRTLRLDAAKPQFPALSWTGVTPS